MTSSRSGAYRTGRASAEATTSANRDRVRRRASPCGRSNCARSPSPVRHPFHTHGPVGSPDRSLPERAIVPNPPEDLPHFVAHLELLTRAYRFARDAHTDERRRGGSGIEHPAAVAMIVAPYADADVVAAALLHDVLEDTTVTREEIEVEFGPSIADLVAALSEDESVEDYALRKRMLREQVAGAGPEAALIFLADKLARIEELQASGRAVEPARFDHYRATLMTLSAAYPKIALATQVRHALRNLPRR